MGNKKSKIVYVEAYPVPSQMRVYELPTKSLSAADLKIIDSQCNCCSNKKNNHKQHSNLNKMSQPCDKSGAQQQKITSEKLKGNIYPSLSRPEPSAPEQPVVEEKCGRLQMLKLAHFAPSQKILMLDPPYWVNPCGAQTDMKLFSRGAQTAGNPLVISKNEEYILFSIYYAMNHALNIRDDFCQAVFSQSFGDMVDQFGTLSYSWLPELPKQIGQDTPGAILPSMSFEQFTPCVFTYLQTYAVGMEEVAWDSKKWKTKGKFNRERGFLEVNLRLRSLLCTVQMALWEEELQKPLDQQRDIMPESDRDPSSQSTADLRDFVIFKEYMNGLEYFRDVYEYMETQRIQSEDICAN
ncbi:uncharacterized protein LOC136037386 [Artemia franciscana]|uniref:Uncharacterized protein n=1 Tax=Artemia franciscana TaxID=6661 RepID=A0AA88I0R4_ARTSF|nr:hypothetical protein QYM36_005077 [Artemia franciscana]